MSSTQLQGSAPSRPYSAALSPANPSQRRAQSRFQSGFQSALEDNLQVRPAATRQTPVPARRRFREALDDGAQRVVQGALALTQVLPAGQGVTATRVGSRAEALSSAGSPGSAGASTPSALGSGAASPGSALGAGSPTTAPATDDTLQLLEMQRRIGAEQMHFSTLSNVMKARHDTAKSVVGNIR